MNTDSIFVAMKESGDPKSKRPPYPLRIRYRCLRTNALLKLENASVLRPGARNPTSDLFYRLEV